ncbi:MAG: tRNA (adenosine(37)-N6)-threonylcarbamoyltransferase complex ATPase subunit type 1 TsaE [Clostridia bacterium]|nr:tRNA (adenosine(37)-N6)-threonylcarbamoyltransferase complex ATPase subunit type 1 TsaE [Clostridia bacterium]
MDKIVNDNRGIVEYYSHGLEDTAYLAQKIAERLNGGEVILLNGQLGAGKTTFTKCLAKSLGVKDTVTSPTFAFMKEYSGRLPLYHFDLYRVADEDELYELGLNEYLYMDGVCVIEWNKFEGVPDPIIIDVSTLDDSDNDCDRLFKVQGIDLNL